MGRGRKGREGMGKERRRREGREGNGSMHPLGFSKVGAYEIKSQDSKVRDKNRVCFVKDDEN